MARVIRENLQKKKDYSRGVSKRIFLDTLPHFTETVHVTPIISTRIQRVFRKQDSAGRGVLWAYYTTTIKFRWTRGTMGPPPRQDSGFHMATYLVCYLVGSECEVVQWTSWSFIPKRLQKWHMNNAAKNKGMANEQIAY